MVIADNLTCDGHLVESRAGGRTYEANMVGGRTCVNKDVLESYVLEGCAGRLAEYALIAAAVGIGHRKAGHLMALTVKSTRERRAAYGNALKAIIAAHVNIIGQLVSTGKIAVDERGKLLRRRDFGSLACLVHIERERCRREGKQRSDIGRVLHRYRNITGPHELTIVIAHINLVGLIVSSRYQACAVSNVVFQVLSPRAMYRREVKELCTLTVKH